MPNYVTNIITFGNDKISKAAFRRMLDAVRADGEPLGSIRFDKIIPMPDSVRRTMGRETDGEPAWRVWCEEHWGIDREPLDWHPLNRDADAVCFFTAWSPVPRIVSEISKKYPEQVVSYQWAEHENIGWNVGEMSLKNGVTLSSRIPEEGSREAFETAARILDIDLSEFGLYLSADGLTYEEREIPIKEPEQRPERRKRGRPAR